jgi:carbamoylphosphate synthase small subunit
MVTGHEGRTFELTPLEIEKILPIVITTWKTKSINEYVNMRDMVKGLNKYFKQYPIQQTLKNGKKKVVVVTDVRMRKIIHHIRVEGIITNLVANSKGYFLTDQEEELHKFAKSCKERANSFNAVYKAMIKHNGLVMKK